MKREGRGGEGSVRRNRRSKQEQRKEVKSNIKGREGSRR